VPARGVNVSSTVTVSLARSNARTMERLARSNACTTERATTERAYQPWKSGPLGPRYVAEIDTRALARWPHAPRYNLRMLRSLLILFTSVTALAQSGPQVQLSHTTEGLRGVSAVSREVAWASGTHGTYLRTTDAGGTWTPAQIPAAATLDFRAVVAFNADEAFLMSAGPGEQSRIYHTADAGQHWQLQFTNKNPKGFFDSMVFWDPKHGVVLGDPIPDDTGKLKFELLLTDDGQTWHQIPPAQLPAAIEGEGAFAASNTCLAILRNPSIAVAATPPPNRIVARIAIPNRSVIPNSMIIPDTMVSPNGMATPNTIVIPHTIVIPSEARNLLFAGATPAAGGPIQPPEAPWKSGASAPRTPPDENGASAPDPNLWFATGGKVARVFHSPDRGQTWQVFDTPIIHGPDSAGIFSIAFRDPTHGVIAGGNYKHPNDDGPNLAFTADAGQTWTLSPLHPLAYFSAVAYDRHVNASAMREQKEEKQVRVKPITPERIFIVGQDFIFDFTPPNNPHRINGKKKLAITFNAAAPYPEGGVLVVGPKGSIASIP
jgi:photosystem II stability/assembly factor-like uncharacterized protein